MNLARTSILSALAIASLLACGSGEDRPPPSGDDTIELSDIAHFDFDDPRDKITEGACEDGATKQCRIYLPSHNDIQPCFVGEQVCDEGLWGDCGRGVLVDANADDAELDPSQLDD